MSEYASNDMDNKTDGTPGVSKTDGHVGGPDGYTNKDDGVVAMDADDLGLYGQHDMNPATDIKAGNSPDGQNYKTAQLGPGPFAAGSE